MSDNESEHSGSEDEQQLAGDQKEKQFDDIRNPDVVTKYKVAAEIAQRAYDLAVKECKVGAKVVDICENVDKFINDETNKVYKDKKVNKGVGYPTCLCINNVVGSFSPLKDDATVLKEGDLIKIDLGVQIDGYVSQVAHTIVLGEITGRKADAIAAAFVAADCAQRLMKPGVQNMEITKIIDRVAKQYKCSTIEGVFSRVIRRFEIEGDKSIPNNIPEVPLTGDNKTKEEPLEANEVWALDIAVSTGAGKPSVVDDRTTVYRRAADSTYQLKMKASRAILSEINTKFPAFPFTIRALAADDAKVKMGVRECANHQLLEPYPVLHEKDGEFVAQVKFTALLLPSGTLRVTGQSIDLGNVKSEIKVTDEEIKKVLAMPLPRNNKKKKKSNKKKKPAAAKPADAAAPAAGKA